MSMKYIDKLNKMTTNQKRQAAEEIGVAVSALYAYQSRVVPSLSVVFKIRDVMGVGVNTWRDHPRIKGGENGKTTSG